MPITRNFTLYLNAGISVAPTVHVNQYDRGEQWVFTLLDDKGQKYTPSSGALIGVKADGNAIAGVTGTVGSNGDVYITETQQMTAAAGKAIFELTIDGMTHGTANFIVQVEKKPTDDAVLSESDLSIIQQGIDSVTPAAINETVSEYLAEHMTNPPIDPTLTVSNAAADAKATGDSITDLKNALVDYLPTTVDTGEWANGSIVSGEIVESSRHALMTGFISGIYDDMQIIFNSEKYRMSIYAYRNDDTYVGSVQAIINDSPYVLSPKNYSPTGYLNRKYKIQLYDRTGNIIVADAKASITVTIDSNFSKDYAEVKNSIDELESTVTDLDARVTALENKPTPIVSDSSVFSIRELIPNYYKTASENLNSFELDYLDEKIKSIPDGKSFIFVTDTHWDNNAKKSPLLINYVRKKKGIKTVIFGGDIINQDESKYVANAKMSQYINAMVDGIGADFLVVPGNHDINTANASNYSEEQLANARIPYSVARQTTMRHLDGSVMAPDETDKLTPIVPSNTLAELVEYQKMHYYYDDTELRIRYIILQQGNTRNGEVSEVFGIQQPWELILQYDWFYDVVMSTPNNYGIVVAVHSALTGDTTETKLSEPVAFVAGILNGLFTKHYANVVTGTRGTDERNAYYEKGTHQYVFGADTPTISFALIVAGHTHYDASVVARYVNNDWTWNIQTDANYTPQSGDILTIVSGTDAYRSNLSSKYAMTDGTLTEQLFDVITITNDNRIVCTRFGAGDTRVFQTV